MEEGVGQQLRRARAKLEAREADPSTSTADLARAFGELGRHYQAYDLGESAATSRQQERNWPTKGKRDAG